MIDGNVGTQLIVSSGFWTQKRTPNGDIAWTYDNSLLPYVVETCVASGTSRFAIPAWARLARQIDTLPASMRRLVDIIDADRHVFDQVRAYLAPVREELKFDVTYEFLYPTVTQDRTESRLDIEQTAAINEVFQGLLRLLLGARYQLQIDARPQRFRRAVQQVRNCLRNPEGRLHLSFVANVLDGYQPAQVDGISLAKAAPAIEERFFEFVADTTYQSMSKEAYAWGIRRSMRHALERFGRLARRIVGHKRTAGAATLISHAVSVGTGIQLPTLDKFAEVSAQPYLPPMVDLRPAFRRVETTLTRLGIAHRLRNDIEVGDMVVW